MVPTIGRVVLYRPPHVKEVCPAIVTATTTNRGILPPLTGDDHVHLTVFTTHPGYNGVRQVCDVHHNRLAGELEPGSWDWPPLTVGEVDMDRDPEEGDERDTLVGVPPRDEQSSEVASAPEDGGPRHCPDHLRG